MQGLIEKSKTLEELFIGESELLILIQVSFFSVHLMRTFRDGFEGFNAELRVREECDALLIIVERMRIFVIPIINALIPIEERIRKNFKLLFRDIQATCYE